MIRNGRVIPIQVKKSGLFSEMDRDFLDFDSVLEVLLPLVRPLVERSVIQEFLSSLFIPERFSDADALGSVLLALFYDKLMISYSLLRDSIEFDNFQADLRSFKISKEQNTFISKVKTIWAQASSLNSNIPILADSFELNKILNLILIENKFIDVLIEIVPIKCFSYKDRFLLLPVIIGDVLSSQLMQDSGQVFTPEAVSSFLANNLINSNMTRIIDPCCGSGLLLFEVLKIYSGTFHHDSVLEIIGVEIDPILAKIAQSFLQFFLTTNSETKVKLRVIHKDFFKCRFQIFKKGISRGQTAVIMNPPYTRHEKLNSKYKSEIRSVIAKDLDYLGFKSMFGGSISKRTGFYLYFVIHATRLLSEYDSMIVIIPNAWMDVDYGITIQRFLLSHFQIRFVVNSECDKLIPYVDVNTVILALVRQGYSKINPSNSRVNFISVKNRACLNDLKIESIDFTTESLDGVRVIDVDINVLKNDNKWGKFFRAPIEYFHMMKKIQDDFISLNEITSIKRGFTTGANEFFYLGKPGNENKYFKSEWNRNTGELYLYLRNDQIKDSFLKQGFSVASPMFKIEKEYWMHRVLDNKNQSIFSIKFVDASHDIWVPNYLVKSSKHINQYLIQESDIEHVVLIIPQNMQLKHGILSYIKWGEAWAPNDSKVRFNQRPTCYTRKPWFALNYERLVNCEFLCLMTINNRFIFFYNPYSFYFDARLYGISVKIEESDFKKVLYLYLNSIIVFFQLELTGRVNLGEGALDVKVYEYASLKLPKSLLYFESREKVTKYFSELLQLKPISILGSKAVISKDLAAFLLGEIMGYSENDFEKLLFHLQLLVRNRLEKARH